MAFLAAALTSLALAGCGPSADASNGQEALGGATAGSPVYYLLAHDPRDCGPPRCGGFFLQPLNESAGATYVQSLDLSGVTFGPALQDDLSAATDDWIAEGVLEASADRASAKELRVTDLYRGLPGNRPGPADGYWIPVGDGSPSPEASHVSAALLNGAGEQGPFVLDVAAARQPFVQADWLLRQVLEYGAVLSAPAPAAPNPDALPVLSAKQVYLRATAEPPLCPQIEWPPCGPGLRATFTRTADRCLVQTGCVEPGLCPALVPQCADGYRLVSWASGPNGCTAFACDPAFLPASS